MYAFLWFLFVRPTKALIKNHCICDFAVRCARADANRVNRSFASSSDKNFLRYLPSPHCRQIKIDTSARVLLTVEIDCSEQSLLRNDKGTIVDDCVRCRLQVFFLQGEKLACSDSCLHFSASLFCVLSKCADQTSASEQSTCLQTVSKSCTASLRKFLLSSARDCGVLISPIFNFVVSHKFGAVLRLVE